MKCHVVELDSINIILPLGMWSSESIIYRNDGCLLKDSETFILFAENSPILLKIYVILILLTFIHLVALNLLVNNQIKSSSNSTHHGT